MKCCPAKKKRLSGSNLAALLWGVSEATFFFIVPDVLISYLALKNYKKSLVACLFVVGGAWVGGVLVYTYSYYHEVEVMRLLDLVPGISPLLISKTNELIKQDVFWGMLAGSFSGIPYKIFAVLAGASSVPLYQFLLISIPVRLARFVVTSSVAAFTAQIVLKSLSHKARLRILCFIWAAFYGFYFYEMGW